jgi:hypothetical protein
MRRNIIDPAMALQVGARSPGESSASAGAFAGRCMTMKRWWSLSGRYIETPGSPETVLYQQLMQGARWQPLAMAGNGDAYCIFDRGFNHGLRGGKSNCSDVRAGGSWAAGD